MIIDVTEAEFDLIRRAMRDHLIGLEARGYVRKAEEAQALIDKLNGVQVPPPADVPAATPARARGKGRLPGNLFPGERKGKPPAEEQAAPVEGEAGAKRNRGK